MAKHETPGRSDEWYTPAFVFAGLGETYQLDVACPVHTSAIHTPAEFYLHTRSLESPWFGFVWMNPPFGGRNGLVPWLDKFFAHAHGIALTPDRTSAPWWQSAAARADAILFWAPKIRFEPGPGAHASSPAQGTTLMAAGQRGVTALASAAQRGHGVLLERVS